MPIRLFFMRSDWYPVTQITGSRFTFFASAMICCKKVLFLYIINCLGSPMRDELPAASMMIPVLLMMQECSPGYEWILFLVSAEIRIVWIKKPLFPQQ